MGFHQPLVNHQARDIRADVSAGGRHSAVFELRQDVPADYTA